MFTEIKDFFIDYAPMLIGIVILLPILLLAALPTISKWLIKTDLFDKNNKNGGIF